MEKLRSGSIVDGYVLTDLIGAGGFAAVYKARAAGGQGAFGPVVAVKILHPRRVERSEVGRFRDEARIILSLQHEYIIKVHAFREIEDNFLIFMEYLDTDLRRFTARRPFTLEEIISILKRAAAGLKYAHSRGVVHRDFNPSNILVSWSLDTLKISDFGIAGRSNPLWRNLLPGTPDTASGTRGYFAPEQHQGHYDERTDIYAFGCTIRSLFRHSNLPLPARMARIVEIATRRDPKERYQSVDELVYALEMTEEAPHPDPWQIQQVMATSRSDPPKLRSEQNNNSFAERVARAKNFSIRVASQEYRVELMRKEPGGELVFTLDGQESLKKQVLLSPGEVVFEENGGFFVASGVVRSADNRTLIVSQVQAPRPERRQLARVFSLSLAAEIVLPGVFRAGTFPATVLNLSMGGARLRSNQALKADREYTLRMSLGGKSCEVKFSFCTVEEKGNTYLYSVRFTEVSERDARYLEDYIHQLIWGTRQDRFR
ncbi:MAG TPA: serine/threonine-protein kinase [bacterium]|nr:serine/threonine-protein kinase [bacterium]